MESISNRPVRAPGLPRIIQGGMGVAVSNWRLARAVSRRGGLGVVSGTALDTVLIRRLQDGDPDGAMRRALAAYPDPAVAERILERWFVAGGRAPDRPYRLKPMPALAMTREATELLLAANFAEVHLAREGHDGWVGINLLEKIQLPTLPSLFGAMLAGVDAVLMGGGIPLEIPSALDALAHGEPAELKLNAVGGARDCGQRLRFDPSGFARPSGAGLRRPLFLAVISSDVLATTLVRKAGGRVDGFVVEHHSAGGHNAPPRRGESYSPRDTCDLDKLRALGRPFWLAGGCASPEALDAAIRCGAQGVQVGTAFALADESGIRADLKREVIEAYRSGSLEVVTDFRASPTGYPLKRVKLPGHAAPGRAPACDLGYLRHVFFDDGGRPAFRCPAAPAAEFTARGGSPQEREGRLCLCNGLLATAGIGQVVDGEPLPPLVTLGEDLSFIESVPGPGRCTYAAGEVIDFLSGAADESGIEPLASAPLASDPPIGPAGHGLRPARDQRDSNAGRSP